eukprot:CAMPEP_0171911318 /NCGR_PEP_ID=MMETSP0993-20121228/10167_1 /TAXON_ID=483369 /ORGANISM="non described non described, Strain CCMP2098" /LENGTH=47 /DNA_ID= /DNA_START= /DNA_END= /DNA_ORIENTATION=
MTLQTALCAVVTRLRVGDCLVHERRDPAFKGLLRGHHHALRAVLPRV